MSVSSWIVPLAEARDIGQVGGKAINLCRLIQAGLPVPDGFVVTTTTFREAMAARRMPEDVACRIRQAYERLGEPTVAVRSSATAEDLAGASMAGQYETFLDVVGADAVVATVERCWQSLQSTRVQIYLAERSIDPTDVAVAVIVQRLVPAEVSGVLFTANPRTGATGEMVVEAVYGLGEGLVSGAVQPDVYCLDAESGYVRDVQVARKTKALRPGAREYQDVPESRAGKACLNYPQLQALRQLGHRAQQHFGCPQDMEWALADGCLHVLQARPITTLAETQAYYALLKETRTHLEAEASRGQGPWVRHNLGETLPLPSPLTWSLIQPFMSGSGGFGRMHERLGFKPSDAVKENGFLTLIAGQIYMDCARLPEMFSAGYPYAYDPEQLRQHPDAAQQPPTVPQGTYRQLAQAARLASEVACELRRQAEMLDSIFDEQFVPRVIAWCEAQAGQNLTTLSDDDLIARWRAQQEMVFSDFGATVFLPSMVEALAAADLRDFLAEHLWNEDPEILMSQLSVSPVPDITLQSNIDLQEVVQGRRSWETWLHDYGFRGPGEFDLASPRWTERPGELQRLAAQLADAPPVAERHHQCAQRHKSV
jgi:pyruvate,water dikinase